jgi:hypothetical protein
VSYLDQDGREPVQQIAQDLRAVPAGERSAAAIGWLMGKAEILDDTDLAAFTRDLVVALHTVDAEVAAEREGTSVPEDLCTAPATVRIEVYSRANGSLYGSLDQVVSVCARHVQAARKRLQAAGYTPYRCNAPATPGTRCGDVFDFTDVADETARRAQARAVER